MRETKKYTGVGLALAAPLCAVLLIFALLALRWDGARALAYLLLWVWLPGCALAQALWPQGGRMAKALAAFYLGAAFLFLLFYLGKAVGSMALLRYLPPLLALAWLLRCAFLRRGAVPAKGREVFASLQANWPLLWLVAIGVGVSCLLTLGDNPTPVAVSNVDYFWHMGNVHTLAASPDLTDLRVSIMPFRYHYFSDLLWACGSIAVGLEPFNAILRYPVLVAPALCAGALWLCLRRCTGRRWLCALGTGAALFLAPLFGIYNDFTYQWATNINAVGLALPCGLLLLYVVLEEAGRDAAGPGGAALVFLLSMLLTGFKGPFTLCLFAAVYGGTVLRLLLRKGLTRRWWWVLLALAAGFVSVWLLLLRTGLNEDYIKSWQLGYSVYTAEVLAPLLVAFGNGLGARLALLPLHMLIVLGALAPPLVTALAHAIGCFAKRKTLPDACLFPLAGAWGSLLAFYMFDLSGRSQFYFLYFAVPLAAMVAVAEAERLLAAKRVKKTAKAALALGAAGMLLFATTTHYRDSTWQRYTPSEVEAALWLRQNYEGGLVATNRHNVFYLVSGLSGAAFWLEGDAYARNSGYTVEALEEHREAGDRLFRDDTPDKAALCREMGVEWLLLCHNETEDYLLAEPGEGFTLVWQGEDAAIWRLAAP